MLPFCYKILYISRKFIANTKTSNCSWSINSNHKLSAKSILRLSWKLTVTKTFLSLWKIQSVIITVLCLFRFSFTIIFSLFFSNIVLICLFAQPMLQRTIWSGQYKVGIDSRGGSWGYTGSEVKRLECDFFQTVILQRAWLVTGTKIICVQICDEINSWNSGVSDNLVFYYYATDTGYLGTAHRNQRADRYHHTFSNLVIPGKLCESVRFIC